MNVFITDYSVLSSIGSTKSDFWSSLVRGRDGTRSICDRVEKSFPIQQASVLEEKIFLPHWSKNQTLSEVKNSFSYLLGELKNIHTYEVDGVFWSSGQFGRKISDVFCDLPNNQTFNTSGDFEKFVVGEIQKLGASFPNKKNIINQSNTCISAITAINSTIKMMNYQNWKRALVFIHESTCREWVLHPYLQLGLLSKKTFNSKLISCPFCKNSSGFIKGEGSVLFLLENDSAVQERAALPYARVLSSGFISDGNQMLRMSSDMESSKRMLTKLFIDAKLVPQNIDYINPYASGSPLNDQMEIELFKTFFEDNLKKIPISTGKPQFGHLNTASGAIEIASVLEMLRHQFVTPTINIQREELLSPNLDFVINQGREHKLNNVLKMSYGFGWSSAGIILAKC